VDNGHFLMNAADLDAYLLKASAPIEDRVNRLLPLHMALQASTVLSRALKLVEHELETLTRYFFFDFFS
jgi:hypothetical protein